MTAKENEATVDMDCVGFNPDTQKLLCLMVLNDELAPHLSDKAGEAFWRAFIVQDRVTGEIHARQRFRYVDHDSWSHLKLNAEQQKMSRAERVAFFQEGLEQVQRLALKMLAHAEPPKDTVRSYFPPDDEGDGTNTINWLLEQDLICVRIKRVDEEPAKAESAPDGRNF